MRKAKDVASYLAGLPDDQRRALTNLRAAILAACPAATELIAYGMPSFKYRGRPLVYMAAAKQHLGLYGPAVLEYQRELAGYDTSKGTIRFTPKKPLPKSLVRKLVRDRMAAIDAQEDQRATVKRPSAHKPAGTKPGAGAKRSASKAAPTRTARKTTGRG